MGAFHSIKKLLEWYEHGRAVVEIVVFVILSLSGGQIMRGLLIQYTRIPSYWITSAITQNRPMSIT